MSRRKPDNTTDSHCTCKRFGHGYYTFEVDGYRAFIEKIAPHFLNAKERYLWRGSRDPSRPLQSTLGRNLRGLKLEDSKWAKEVCRLTIVHALRYLELLRGLNRLKPRHEELHRKLSVHIASGPPPFLTVLQELGPDCEHELYELFSTGQHHYLYTPFLDWTDIPLVALFFAFNDPDDAAQPADVGHRVVYALNHARLIEKCPPNDAAKDFVFLGSMANDNPRIIGQSGMFSFIREGLSVDEWVVEKFDAAEKRPVLIRFLIRNEKRDQCLKHLAAMNIHKRSLFPDMFGAARRANDVLLDEVSSCNHNTRKNR